jgi:hypothetical protein
MAVVTIERPSWPYQPARGHSPQGRDPHEWTWARAHLLLGAARLARRRTQVADTWTYIAAGYFLLWTVVILLGL